MSTNIMYYIHIFQLPFIIFIRTCTGNNTITEHCLHGVCMSYDEINRMRTAETYTGRGEGVGKRTNYTCFIQKLLSPALCDGSQYICIHNKRTHDHTKLKFSTKYPLSISRHSNRPMGDWTTGRCSLYRWKTRVLDDSQEKCVDFISSLVCRALSFDYNCTVRFVQKSLSFCRFL